MMASVSFTQLEQSAFVPPEDFNRLTIVNHKHKRLFDEIAHIVDGSILFSEINTSKLVVQGSFIEVENSTFKSINAKGQLRIHNCLSPIELVIASENVSIYGCAKISRINAPNGNVYITKRLVDGAWDCKYGEIVAKNLFISFVCEEIPDSFTVHDYSAKVLNIPGNIKRLNITGNCINVLTVVFQESHHLAEEREVIVEKGASFRGNVKGGKCVNLNYL
jgi:hypothetical protein